MEKTKEKKASAVEPRVMQMMGAVDADIVQEDQADRVTDMENVMNADMRGQGRMFSNNRAVIADTYSCPGFQDDGRGNFIEPISERVVGKGDAEGEEVKNSILLKRFDCNHGCNTKESVQPVNSTGRDWQCSECGKEYNYS